MGVECPCARRAHQVNLRCPAGHKPPPVATQRHHWTYPGGLCLDVRGEAGRASGVEKHAPMSIGPRTRREDGAGRRERGDRRTQGPGRGPTNPWEERRIRQPNLAFRGHPRHGDGYLLAGLT